MKSFMVFCADPFLEFSKVCWYFVSEAFLFRFVIWFPSAELSDVDPWLSKIDGFVIVCLNWSMSFLVQIFASKC